MMMTHFRSTSVQIINISITIVTVFFGRNLEIEEIPSQNKLFFPKVDWFQTKCLASQVAA